jgi:hypothetical protein
MEGGERAPWERLDSESAGAYIAFRRYRDLGPSRTVRASYGTPPGRRVPGHLQRWAAHHRWQARALAWDDECYRTADRRHLDAIAGGGDLHLLDASTASNVQLLDGDRQMRNRHLDAIAAELEGDVVVGHW